MPDKPLWYGRLDVVLQQIEAFPSPWIDRATLQSVLGVGARRSQQILRPLVQRTIGKNGLASKEGVIQHLRELATGEAAVFERRRRERLHDLVDRWHVQSRTQPRVLVEAPEAVVNQELDSLPSGIQLMPGRITIEGFSTPDEAKQKLLALILAIGNDPDGFDTQIDMTTPVT
jgi:hypothetical protein